MNTKTIKLIVILFLLILLIFSFIKCSSPVGSGSVQADETSSGPVDFSTMPSDSEFLNEESE